MIALIATVLGVLVAVALLIVLELAGNHPIGPRLATVAGAPCLVLFVLVNVSDWPGGFLNQFWLEHAIIGASAGTMLLGATVYLVYRYRDHQQQRDLDESVVDAGQSGLVDHLIDIDVGLSLVCREDASALDRWPDWQDPERPLRWLRHRRHELLATANHKPSAHDPRSQVPVVQVPDEQCGSTCSIRWFVASPAASATGVPSCCVPGKASATSSSTRRSGSACSRSKGCSPSVTRLGPAKLTELQHKVRELAWRLEESGQAPIKRNELVQPDGPEPAVRPRLRLARVLGRFGTKTVTNSRTVDA